MGSAISIQGLRKNFGATAVLRDINLDIKPGEFTVLLGASGCGKSTLLSAIAGLEEVDSGNIIIDDRNVVDMDASKRGIGMVFQSYALYPSMTVKGNLCFSLKVAKVSKSEIEHRMERVANMLQLKPLLDRKPSQLSGGQRQRVAIGRALMRQTQICLFDEPLSNLDAKLRTQMRMELKRLHESLGMTMVYVTHDQIEAMTLADRIAVMRAGSIEQYADPATVYEKPATLFVAGFVGSPSMNFIEGAFGFHAGSPCLLLDSGDHIDLAGYPFKVSPAPDMRMVLGLRPEHLHCQSQHGPGTLTGRITIVEPMGADTLLWLEVGKAMLSARVSPQTTHQVGDSLTLNFNPAIASLFSAESGLRL